MYYIYHRATGQLIHKTNMFIVLPVFDPAIYEVVIY
jgi:hypothetical protein